jgi:hypothetical protein
MRLLSRAFVMCVCGGVVSACAGNGQPVASSFSLPMGRSASLAAATAYTSPDGGIYQNPDHVEVHMVVHKPVDSVAAMLPGALQQWQPLRSLGDFTFVGLTVRNDGKAFSDLQLNATQVASDYAPDGTSTGVLRAFYHPLFPLALLSVHGSDSSCTVHVDPGQTVVAVLVYPPLRQTDSIVWGVYHAFAVRAPAGGELPMGSYAWRATACTHPQPEPAS